MLDIIFLFRAGRSGPVGNINHNIPNIAMEHFAIGINFVKGKIVIVFQAADFSRIQTELVFQVINGNIVFF